MEACEELALVLSRGLQLDTQRSSRDSLQCSSGYSTQTTTPCCSEDTIPSQGTRQLGFRGRAREEKGGPSPGGCRGRESCEPHFILEGARRADLLWPGRCHSAWLCRVVLNGNSDGVLRKTSFVFQHFIFPFNVLSRLYNTSFYPILHTWKLSLCNLPKFMKYPAELEFEPKVC